jgi:hypothetical protein
MYNKSILVLSGLLFCSQTFANNDIEDKLDELKWLQLRNNHLIQEQQWQQEEATRFQEYQQRIQLQEQYRQRQLDYQRRMYNLDR